MTFSTEPLVDTPAFRQALRLEQCLARLWRYAVALSSSRDTADDLVQSTCLSALERADQFTAGTRIDRWLFAILRSIWLNEIRARRIREGGGFVDAEEALTLDGAHQMEVNIQMAQVLNALGRLPGAQRVTALLVYGEGNTYAEAAAVLGVPIGTVMSRLATVRAALAGLK
jgi:RNA polymerase sigma-70 factor (ECF subfamily)